MLFVVSSIVASSCNLPTIAQATITPQQLRVLMGSQITITCMGINTINGGTDKSLTLHCVSGGFSKTPAGRPEILPVCNTSNGE